MSKRSVARYSSLWQSVLIGMIFWMLPSCIYSQEVSLAKQGPSNPGQAFAGFDDSLTRVADALLDSVAQSLHPTSVSTNAEEKADTRSSMDVGMRSRAVGDGGQNAAAVRLSVLGPVVEPILTSHGVPANLAAIILVESAGRFDALSPKGARGLWQLMPDTARRYGLHVDAMQDDRLDLLKSTEAAASYLHELYAQFGDWKLSLAAYNTGEANVGAAILRAHSQDFDRLSNLRMLPRETRNYVPRVLATAQSVGLLSAFADRPKSFGSAIVFAASSR
jgi:hypothetical protein